MYAIYVIFLLHSSFDLFRLIAFLSGFFLLSDYVLYNILLAFLSLGWVYNPILMGTRILLRKSMTTWEELLMREVSIDCVRNTVKDFFSHLEIEKSKLR